MDNFDIDVFINMMILNDFQIKISQEKSVLMNRKLKKSVFKKKCC